MWVVKKSKVHGSGVFAKKEIKKNINIIEYTGEKINIAVTGDVVFKIIKSGTEIDGNCYESYQIESGDQINLISTNKSVYGYLAIGGGLDLKLQWNSCSINTKANIGSNDGKKLENGQKINILNLM